MFDGLNNVLIERSAQKNAIKAQQANNKLAIETARIASEEKKKLAEEETKRQQQTREAEEKKARREKAIAEKKLRQEQKIAKGPSWLSEAFSEALNKLFVWLKPRKKVVGLICLGIVLLIISLSSILNLGDGKLTDLQEWSKSMGENLTFPKEYSVSTLITFFVSTLGWLGIFFYFLVGKMINKEEKKLKADNLAKKKEALAESKKEMLKIQQIEAEAEIKKAEVGIAEATKAKAEADIKKAEADLIIAQANQEKAKADQLTLEAAIIKAQEKIEIIKAENQVLKAKDDLISFQTSVVNQQDELLKKVVDKKNNINVKHTKRIVL